MSTEAPKVNALGQVIKPFTFKSFEEFNPNKKFTACFMGKHGSGKSIAALSIAKIIDKPVYHAFFDGRLASVYKFYKKYFPELLKNVDPRRYTLGDFARGTKEIETAARTMRYGAFIIDPLIAYGNGALQLAMDSAGAEARKIKGTNIYVPHLQDYKTEAAALNKLMDFVQTVNAHVILCAHYYEIQEPDPMLPMQPSPAEKAAGIPSRLEGAQVMRKQVLVAGKMIAEGIPGFFDEVWFFEKRPGADLSKGVRYICSIHPNNRHLDLKTSRPELPKEVEWTNELLFPKLKIALGSMELEDLPPEPEPPDEDDAAANVK